MANLGEKYIKDHCNPVVKTEVFGSKLFLPVESEVETHSTSKCLLGVENILRHDRVDRRCARNVAKWLSQENRAIVTKIVGSCLSNYGYQNKKGKFLNIEEIMFLLESNKLELFFNDLPLSMQEAYEIVLKKLQIQKYFVFKKLALQGYRVQMKRRECEEEVSEPPRKLAKIDETEESSLDIFNKLRQSGPKLYQTVDSSPEPDYFITSPHSAGKSSEERNVVIKCANEEFSSTSVNEGTSTVYALSSDDEVVFYKFFNSNIPIL